MDIYVARQPIFDRYMQVYGYELLYRRDNLNGFPGVDDNQATAELLYNAFMVLGLHDLTEGTRAFINFSKKLIGSDVPYLLPSSGVVLEVLERGEVTSDTIEACKNLRAKGYKVALDDFVPGKDNEMLLEHADIVKVEFRAVSLEEQRRLIRKFGATRTFLAEKIETREDYKKAAEMGYSLFQGYFFSKPAVIAAKEIGALNTNLMRIMKELSADDPSFEVIEKNVEHDLGLSYRLLRLVNSVYYGPTHKIKTIWHALTHLGVAGMRQWFSIMMLKEIQNIENAEMVKASLTRGKLMELLAEESGDSENRSDYFFAGLFSQIDILLDKPMKEILDGLPIEGKIKRALLGEANEYRALLDCVVAIEKGDWEGIDSGSAINLIGARRFMSLYIRALRWGKRLEN